MLTSIKSWAIQSSGLRINDAAEERLLEALRTTCTSHVSFGCIPFTNEITGWRDFPDEQMFVHCSTKVLRILTDKTIPSTEIFAGADEATAERIRSNMLAGIFYDINAFDQAVYCKLPVREHLLNGDCRVVKIKDWLHEEFPREYFIKPTKDLKSFKGGIISAGQSPWQMITGEGMIDVSFEPAVEAGETMLIASVRTVSREYRFFVVDGAVITGSMYMFNGSVQYSDLVPDWVALAANRMATLYQPARAFTMDLGIVEGEIDPKIVEYNCINCSGLYHTDIDALIRSIAYMR